MSYPSSIDDIPTVELLQEVARRQRELINQLCPYCGVKLTEHTCRYREEGVNKYHEPTQVYCFVMSPEQFT